MNTPPVDCCNPAFGKSAWPIVILLAGLICSGCSVNEIIYYKGPTGVNNQIGMTAKDYLVIEHYYGLTYYTPEGARRPKDRYVIYFKNGSEFPDQFYFTMSEPWGNSQLVESRGSVQLLPDDYVQIDVEYRDAKGRWLRPPIDGKQKINAVTPPWRDAWPVNIYGPFFDKNGAPF